ncbi:MAG: SEC-C domain-containing protein [Heliobacteriaceae bacterium]|jgi:hypothetical protein|nr:SEC-C domain-containing protein [Heliobacteriaceae bacterium]
MQILEKLKRINDVIKDIAVFVREDSYIKPDFEEYLKTTGAPAENAAACFNYIFERNLDGKSIIELYSRKKTDNADIVSALMKSFSSVFEVKRQTKNGFEIYGIVNEKTYSVTSLVKMTNFRGIGSGQYISARIFEYGADYYLLEISGVLPIYKKDEALRYAVAKIIQNPELVYLDNPEKLEELEKNVKTLYKKFTEYFGSDEVITTNKFADEIISLFNDYTEGGEKTDFKDKIQTPEVYRFFNINEFNNNYHNFLENSLGGFSSHSEVYDVGVVFDEESGLYAVPFYGTFNKMFETEIEGGAQCLEYFLNNDKFPPNLIKRVAARHAGFMDTVNKILGTKFTLDELLREYKDRYTNNKIFSSTTVLYKSRTFSNILGIIEEERPKTADTAGRNDPCPCGSGKKFKKCCGA